MSTITWTHVDKLVRDLHDARGMLPTGSTDAEVAHAFIKWLSNQYEIAEESLDGRDRELLTLRQQLSEATPIKLGKTKQRLSVLEAKIAYLEECFKV